MNAGADRGIRSITTGCVALLALIAGTVSYLHMHLLVELNGQQGLLDGSITPTPRSSPAPRPRQGERAAAQRRSWGGRRA
jgi:hypothetical protein